VLTVVRERLSLIQKLRMKVGGADYTSKARLHLNSLLVEDAELFKTDAWKRMCVMLEDTISNCKGEVFRNALNHNAKNEVLLQTAIAEVCMKMLSLTQQTKEEGIEALANSKIVEKMEETGANASVSMLSVLQGVKRD